MTTTLAGVRDRLRTRLEDTSGSPLWADATLDEGLKRALDDYSQWRPAEAAPTFTATADDVTAELPSETLRVLRVTDPTGWVIPPQHDTSLRYTADEELSWSFFAGLLRFSRPLAAGTYTVYTLGARSWPDDDATAFPVPDSDLGLIVAGAAVYALEVRGVQEWKRGPLPTRYAQAILDARSAYASEWRERRRVLRAATLGSTN